MNIQEVQEHVTSIGKDLHTVQWTETTPTTTKLFEGVEARTFSGTGLVWAHNLIVWQENGKARCDGSAVMLSKPLIVRYTPEMAQVAMKQIQDKGLNG